MMIYTLTLNPAFDLHYEMDDFIPFSENYVKKALRSSGGKGINVSKALCALGAENKALVILGKENGAEFLKELKDMEILPFETEGRIRENITIHPKEGKETRISLDNFYVPEKILIDIENHLISRCSEKTIVAFAGRLPKGIDKSRAIEFLIKIKKTGARIAMDSNSFTLSDMEKIRPWLIKPNEVEVSGFWGKEVRDYEKAAKELHSLGVENVMISLGGDGIVYAGLNESFYVKAPKLSPVSTIGAGDSALAGFMAGYERGLKLRGCVSLAAATGSAACLAVGTLPPERENIEKFFEEILGEKETE